MEHIKYFVILFFIFKGKKDKHFWTVAEKWESKLKAWKINMHFLSINSFLDCLFKINFNLWKFDQMKTLATKSKIPWNVKLQLILFNLLSWHFPHVNTPIQNVSGKKIYNFVLEITFYKRQLLYQPQKSSSKNLWIKFWS